MSSTNSDHHALVDDAVHEINQRWGEPWGDDMLPMDQKLVRETAEAILAPLEAQVERLRTLIGELYVQRGKDVNTLRTAIRRAFHEANA